MTDSPKPTSDNGFETLWPILRADAEQYQRLGGWARNLGFWIGATHRVAEWARSQRQPLRRLPALVPAAVLTRIWRATLGVHLMKGASFGPGLCLPRPRSMMIGCVLTGADCTIYDHVTIGTNANSPGYARIGDHVEIGSGARILGSIRIGNEVRCGPSTVIVRNIPSGSDVSVVTPVIVRDHGAKP
jgi:serine acetyltransferase